MTCEAIILVKVLVVDDHPLFRSGLVEVISGIPGLQVVGEIGTCKEAIDKAISEKPDVITMDLCLPDGSGVECTAALHELLPQVQILVITVSDSDEDLFTALKAGARGYILKDASPAQISS